LTYEEKTREQTTRAHPKQTGKKSRRSRPFSFYIRLGVPRIFLTALHSYVAVGCPDDCGEQLLATENSQPVTNFGMLLMAWITAPATFGYSE